MYQTIKIDPKNKTALITITRPESLNALNQTVIQELIQALDEIKDNKDIKVILITGSGDKAFVAGADIKEFKDYNTAQGTDLSLNGQNNLFNKIETYPKPIIALINGYALGGGLELALACHFRLASDKAKLGLPEITLGLIPGYGGTQRLPLLIGKGRAMQMILTAELINAKTALDIGLVNEVYPTEELLDKGYSIAQKIASYSSQALAVAIESINASNTSTGYEKEANSFGLLFATDNFKEGVNAFLEKESPFLIDFYLTFI